MKMKHNTLILWYRKRYKILQPNQYTINRNTPHGEPADFYEHKPYNGRRKINEEEILGFIDKNGNLEIHNCKLTINRLDIIKVFCYQNTISISNRLFHNGQVYTTIKNPFRTLKQALQEQKNG